MTTREARFAVDGWEERSLEGLGDGWLGTVEMRKTFTSGLVGTSVALFASSGDVEGQRSYFAAERITAALEAAELDRSDLAGTDPGDVGSLTVHHGGLESSPESWFGHVVPHSGTGPFEGWAGWVRIVHDDEGARFVFDLM